MYKKFNLIVVLFSLLVLPTIISSCGGDEEKEDFSYYDFSIVWDVVDRGDYSTAEAMGVAAGLTEVCEDIFTACTEDVAKRQFAEFCERLRYEFATGYMKITLKARLVRNEGNKSITSKTFYIDPNGTTIKAPAKDGEVPHATVYITD